MHSFLKCAVCRFNFARHDVFGTLRLHLHAGPPHIRCRRAADAIRHPVVKPDRDVRPFQDVILDLGARLRFRPIKKDGQKRYPGGYPDYLANHERLPGVGMLAGFRGEDGHKPGDARSTRTRLMLISTMIASGFRSWPMISIINRNQAYLTYAQSMGFIKEAKLVFHQLYSEQLQNSGLPRVHGEHQPPVTKRERIETHFDPLLSGRTFEDQLNSQEEYPLHAVTSPAMYHSWGSQNAWLRQLHGYNKLYLSNGSLTNMLGRRRSTLMPGRHH